MTALRWTETKSTKYVVLHAKQAQEGGRGIALPILDAGARKGWWVVCNTPMLFTPRKETLYAMYTEGW